ncbi:signal recognition particle, SRP9/SRP14 subunit [Cylindrobasidium torrendii FP15055 ss-10]|uniref:Signal recognition particle subunit SRP14 n=1 Tax=Cylindrobasidium torrendii FP15055 ss-10 TaxID=1314674 RepID=A0A0D7B5V5_9AGAR|nr:signal recognition particle, SRP9/SRP14 subunit [Cylindrobasidium torrendii FP15055 ss-10]
MQLVDSETFLQNLQKLFAKSQDTGSIWLTHKRLTHDGENATITEGADDSREYQCLVRLSDGGKYKYETKVSSAEVFKFNTAYGTLLKASFTQLRKRDKKREKQKADELARKKQKLAEPVIVDGKKRGAGRRKRQRQLKAAGKQQTAVERAKAKEMARSSESA